MLKVKEIQLQKGDKLLFYTDGLVEAKGADNTMFEEKLVPDLLTRYNLLANEEYINKILEKPQLHPTLASGRVPVF